MTISLVVLPAAVPTLAGGGAAQAVPGVPASPTVLYTEGFENTGSAPLLLTNYVSTQGTTYTADAPWLRACNGQIVQGSTPDSDIATSNCTLKTAVEDADAFWAIRNIARVLGIVSGTGTPTDNHAVAAYTDGQNPGANGVEFKTVAPITLPSNTASRFITFSVNAAATSCWSTSPQYNFALINAAGTEIPVGGTPAVCSGTDYGNNFIGGTFTSNGSVLFNGNSLGIVMRNANGSGSGNDAGFDDIKVLDVTPQLDKSFSPALIGTNQTSRMTFTVTNTSELAAKSGFSFTDDLPAGMVIASNPNFSSTCAPASITAGGTAGATTVSYRGSLAAGQTSCTFDINVTSASEGTFVNAPGPNVKNEVGLIPPPPATLEVRDPRLTLVKELNGPRRLDTDQFTVQIHQGSAGGPVVNNTTNSTTTGTGSTVTSGTGTTGSYHALAGTTYHLGEVAAGTTRLGRYDATITCVDANGRQTGLPTDAPLSGTRAVTPVAGADITCTITNTELKPDLSLDKRVTSVTDVNGNGLTDAGDRIRYEFELTNTGQLTLTNLAVSDPLVGAVTCPVTTLAPGASTVCTADNPYVITQADVNAGNVHNRATAAGEAPGGDPNDPSDDVPSNPDTTDTPTDQVPELGLDKRVASVTDVNGNGLTDAGDEIAYEFELTNTGTLPLTGLSVTDPLVGAVTCPVTTLAPGDSTVCTADNAYVITAADVDAGNVHNRAVGHGTPPTGPSVDSPPDTTDTPTDQDPELGLDKRVASVTDVNGNGLTDAGDTISYEFELTNTGNVTLTDLAVSDPLAGAVTCPVTTLAAGAATVCTADNAYVITQADVDAGSVDNVAIAHGTPPTGPTVDSPPDTTTTPTDLEPGLTLDKRVASVTDVNGNGLTDAGDEITWEFELTNDGTVTLTAVGVSDPLAGAVTCPVTTLAPGASTVCTADAAYVITAADVDAGNVHNIATGHGTPPTGPSVDSPPDTTDTPTDQDPELALDKRVASVTDMNGNGLTDAGDTIAYEFELTNTGNVTLTDLAVSDPLAGAVTCSVTTLAAGDSTLCAADNAYVITQADVNAGSVNNTATAVGEGPGGDPSDPSDDVPSNPDSTTTPTDQVPALTLDKRVASVTDVNGNGVTDAGDEIAYEFELTNTGNVTLTDVAVSDPLAGAVTCPVTTLAPGESTVCTADAAYVITAADVDAGNVHNRATAAGEGPGGDPNDPSDDVPSNPDTTDTPTDQVPELALYKRVASVTDVNGNGLTDAGDEIAYEFELTNTGNVTLTDLAVSDPLVGAVTCVVTTLAAGDSTLCTADNAYVITQADADAGSVNNTATAVGEGPGGDPGDPADDVPSNPDSTVTPTDQVPELGLDKRVASVTDVNGNGLTDAGDEIRYEFELTNTGTVTLTDLKVSDPLAGAVTCQVTTLAAGESTVCTADNAYVITDADVDAGNVHNRATAVGEGPGGDPNDPSDDVPSNPDTTDTPTDQVPELGLDKRVASVTDVNGNGLTDAGDEIAYEFELTNTGNVTLTDVAVSDPLIGAVICPVTTLAPGASTVCHGHAPYVLTQADVDAGSVHNTAIGHGTPPTGPPVDSPPDTTDTPTDQVSGLELDKRVASVTDVNGNGLTDVGDTISYEFELTNTGTVTLSDLKVSDPMIGSVSCPGGPLAAGDSVVCVGDRPHVVTAADVDAGEVRNTATATGTPPGGPNVDSPPDTVTTPTDPPNLPNQDDPDNDNDTPGFPNLPNTGGPALVALLAGGVLLTGGLVLTVTSRRRRA